ncbi:MAG: alanine racemase C-terminal domain-containing protein [Ruminococcus callidus]
MLDVTDAGLSPGDVVTMFGTDGEETITADELAALYGTIGYEIVCGISKRVPRDDRSIPPVIASPKGNENQRSWWRFPPHGKFSIAIPEKSGTIILYKS